ncbi:MAG: glucosamine-6-phosphate deaminase [Thermoanaerobacteraceae bacterium]|nr:glucosamine-6-phosphate deaminase [Thermoanaerobacteraceae bacterium]
MKTIIEETYEGMSRMAARIVADEIRKKPDMVLGLATGGTPLGMYKELIRIHKQEGLDFSRVITFNLDEYYGLSPDNEQSYHYYMYENFFKHINIKPENIHIPDGTVEDINEFCEEYDREIQRVGGIDLQVLGIGRNGHIGFNEPGDELITETHVTTLTEETRIANARFFGKLENVPEKAVTMGLGTIMKAKKILLLASGREKAGIMSELLSDTNVTTKVPASFLHLHPDTTVIMDRDSAMELLAKKL